ncbi:unnamed protein product, partial [Rotaria magnacalcarata]
EHKFELSLHIAAIHHSDNKLFQKNNEEVEVDDGEDDDDIEDEHSFDKEEDISDDSEQNIDLLE